MSDTKKIRVEAIEQLERDVESIPQCEVEEISRAMAGRRLVPHVRALRAKGYNLEAISEIFTERGVPIPATSLASYMKEARRGSSRSKAKKRAATVGEDRTPTPKPRCVTLADAPDALAAGDPSAAGQPQGRRPAS